MSLKSPRPTLQSIPSSGIMTVTPPPALGTPSTDGATSSSMLLGESIFGDVVRLSSKVHSTTARVYQVSKEERVNLMAVDWASSSSYPQSPNGATTRRSEQGASSKPAGTGHTTGSSPTGGLDKAPLWRVATTTDLLLIATCVLINVPSFAKMLAAVSMAAEPSGVSLTPYVAQRAMQTGVDSLGDAIHSAAPDGLRGMAEYLTRVFAVAVLTTPHKCITALESACQWIFVDVLSPSLSPSLPAIVEGMSALSHLWRTSILPLITPAVFWTIVLVVLVAVRVWLHARQVYMEEIVVVRNLGMQLTTRDYRGCVTRSKFIDISRIRSVFIHEAFFRHQVVFFLGVLVDNEPDIVVLLDETMPRLCILKPLLCGIRAVLFQEPEEGPTLGDMEARSGGSGTQAMGDA